MISVVQFRDRTECPDEERCFQDYERGQTVKVFGAFIEANIHSRSFASSSVFDRCISARPVQTSGDGTVSRLSFK